MNKETYLRAKQELEEKFKTAIFPESIKLLEKQSKKLNNLYFGV